MLSCLFKRPCKISTLLPCALLGPYLDTPSHFKFFSWDFPNCFFVDGHLLCYAPDIQLTIFTQNLTTLCNVFFNSAYCWPSWSLFVSDTFSSLRKTFRPLVNCYFLHSIIPVKLPNMSLVYFPLFPSLTRNLMFVRCSNSSSDILAAVHQSTRRHNRCLSEIECHRSITATQLWILDMSTTSNHTKNFVQYYHDKHTVTS